MSFADDAYEDMMIERYMFSNSIEQYKRKYSPQKVVNDAIASFARNRVDEEHRIEVVSRDILKTIARTKRASDKQKECLVKLLVLRGDDDYEVKYNF